MDDKTLNALFTLVNLLILAFTAYNATRRGRSQNILDGTQSLVNLQETIESMQELHKKERLEWKAELEKEREENKYLRSELEQIKVMLKEAFIEVRVGLEVGQPPVILGYEWATKEAK